MLYFLWNFIFFIISLTTMIVVHEFGHFIVAKYFNVAIESVSFGFGKSLYKWNKGGTEYNISMIPLGGYVKMFDKKNSNLLYDKKYNLFENKPIWQRVSIVIAGPIFNFLFSVFIYWIIFIIGFVSYKTIIKDVIPYSIAANANIKPGMEIKSIDDVKINDWNDVRLCIAKNIGSKNILKMLVKHTKLNSFNKKNYVNEFKYLILNNMKINLNYQDPMYSIGIIPIQYDIDPVISKIKKNSIAEKLKLKVGDRILRINNKDIYSWPFFLKKLHNNIDNIFNIEIKRNNELFKLNLKPYINMLKKSKCLGIIPTFIHNMNSYLLINKLDPLHAFLYAFKKSFNEVKFTFLMLIKLMIGNISVYNLHGPINIAYNAGNFARHGFFSYLLFLSLISINLCVINLIPIPILDGGHLMFLLIEKIQGYPVSKNIQNISYRISSVLLVLLMIFVLFNDISIL
ncbi:MAG: RIP metalloprotease RseP [Enterobacterales bacterium]